MRVPDSDKGDVQVLGADSKLLVCRLEVEAATPQDRWMLDPLTMNGDFGRRKIFTALHIYDASWSMSRLFTCCYHGNSHAHQLINSAQVQPLIRGHSLVCAVDGEVIDKADFRNL